MKKYTILERIGCEGPEVMMVPTEDIYDFVHLCTAEDGAYIRNKNGILETTDDAYNYPVNYFDDKEERLVIKVSDTKVKDQIGIYKNYERMMAYDEREGKEVRVIDITSLWMSYVAGKAVDIEHGITTATICFDIDDTNDDFWHSAEEVDAEWETEHQENYPHQEYTAIATCSNGKKIREISPFFADEHMPVYEYVKD